MRELTTIAQRSERLAAVQSYQNAPREIESDEIANVSGDICGIEDKIPAGSHIDLEGD